MLKLKSYSITNKLSVIASINEVESQTNVLHDNSITESTICGRLKGEEKLCDFVARVDSTEWMKCKTPKLSGGFHMVFEKEAYHAI